MTEDTARRTFNRAVGELNERALARTFNRIWWLA
jgi:hypothetical protein